MIIACNLPYHVYGYVDKSFLSQAKEKGWEKAIWFAVTLPPNRAVGLTVLLQNGAVYRQLPPHAWAFEPAIQCACNPVQPECLKYVESWTIQQAQAWDCFGGDAQVIEYQYLRGLTVEALCLGHISPVKREKGSYLFTIEFENDGFSRYPAQSKCLHCISLENGRLTLQPNDHLLWTEHSFTDHSLSTNYLRRQENVYDVEP